MEVLQYKANGCSKEAKFTVRSATRELRDRRSALLRSNMTETLQTPRDVLLTAYNAVYGVPTVERCGRGGGRVGRERLQQQTSREFCFLDLA